MSTTNSRGSVGGEADAVRQSIPAITGNLPALGINAEELLLEAQVSSIKANGLAMNRHVAMPVA